jgi:hypothetical protein
LDEVGLKNPARGDGLRTSLSKRVIWEIGEVGAGWENIWMPYLERSEKIKAENLLDAR